MRGKSKTWKWSRKKKISLLSVLIVFLLLLLISEWIYMPRTEPAPKAPPFPRFDLVETRLSGNVVVLGVENYHDGSSAGSGVFGIQYMSEEDGSLCSYSSSIAEMRDDGCPGLSVVFNDNGDGVILSNGDSFTLYLSDSIASVEMYVTWNNVPVQGWKWRSYDRLVVESGVSHVVGPNSGGADYNSIQAAIDAANSGDTIRVLGGIYNETIVVNKTLTLLGNGITNTTINGRNSGTVVVNITADGVNIAGFAIMGGGTRTDYGISLYNASRCVIEENKVSNATGIYLQSSNNNTIKGNIAFNGWVGIRHGIHLVDSNNNTIKGNIALNNTSGIFISVSRNNFISDNIASSNKFNGIGIWHSNNNTIKGNIASNNDDGIWLVSSSNSTITDNAILSNDKGIYLSNSTGTFVNNTISNNGYGIYFSPFQYSNIIADNIVNGNRKDINKPPAIFEWWPRICTTVFMATILVVLLFNIRQKKTLMTLRDTHEV